MKNRLQEIEPSADGVTAALFYPLAAREDGYDPRVNFDGQPLGVFTDEMGKTFLEYLTKTISEILDMSTDFEALPSDSNCRWCDFKPLCGRKEEKDF